MIATLAETIKYAADNKVLLEIGYNGTIRSIEVYSYRTARNGNMLLYGFDVNELKTKSFTVANIESVKATDVPYSPRYPVEI